MTLHARRCRTVRSARAAALRLCCAALSCAAVAACGGGGNGGPVTAGDRPEAAPHPAVPGAGESFRGENRLEARLSGLPRSGKIGIVDLTCPGGREHCELVTAEVVEVGVDRSDIVIVPDTTEVGTPIVSSTYLANKLADYAMTRDDVRVMVVAVTHPLVTPRSAQAIAPLNVLLVVSAGNTRRNLDRNELILDSRNVYAEGHPDWHPFDQHDWGVADYSAFEETKAALETGRAILVTWGDVDSRGEVVPYPGAFRCGDLMEACFTLVLPEGHRGDPRIYGTSFASPRAGAAAYYLFQLWDRVEDVLSTLKECAIDVGAPGPDIEFGMGVISVDCPAVAAREVRTAARSMRTELSSPAIDSMDPLEARPAGLSLPLFGFSEDGEANALGGLAVPGLYLSDRYRALGLSVPFAGGEMTGVWGRGVAPLGISSTLVPAREGLFFEVGMKREILRLGGGSVSVVGTHGSADDGIESSATRLGLRHEWGDGVFSFSLYAGGLRATAKIGLPGQAEVGRDRVAVRTGAGELRARFRTEF